jgi:hypothetical protein
LYDIGHRWQQSMPFWPPLSPADEPNLRIHRGYYKLNNFSFILMNMLKSFVWGLGKYVRNAARHSGGMD